MKALRNQRGMALLLVLVVVALLTALLTEFSFSTLVDLRSAETFRDRSQAFYLARGGIEAGRMILRTDRNNFDHPSEFWGDLMSNIPAGDGDVTLEINDLSGRLNLNGVADTRGNKQASFHRFVALSEDVLQLSYGEAVQLGEALVNWYNADRNRVTSDDGYYQQQQPPYERKGGKLDTIDELLLVRGFDEETLRRLRPYVRVQGADSINVNTAPEAVLDAWQHSSAPGLAQIIFDRTDIESLVEYRQQTPFQELADMAKAQGIGNRWSAAWDTTSITVKGNIFQLRCRGRINQVTRSAEAVVEKSSNKLLSLRVE